MPTTGKIPPPTCNINIVRPLKTGETALDYCVPVESNFVYVVLSSNPDNDLSANVSWPEAGSIPVQALPDNNLILRGATTQDTAPDVVTLQFEGCDPTDEPCSVTTCVPEGC